MPNLTFVRIGHCVSEVRRHANDLSKVHKRTVDFALMGKELDEIDHLIGVDPDWSESAKKTIHFKYNGREVRDMSLVEWMQFDVLETINVLTDRRKEIEDPHEALEYNKKMTAILDFVKEQFK